MLTELRRCAAVLHGCGAQADRIADTGDFGAVAALERDFEAAFVRLLHLEHLFQIVDRPVGHAARIELYCEIIDLIFSECASQLAEREIAIDLAQRRRGEPRVTREVVARECRAQGLPLRIVATGDDEMAVGALEGFVRHHDAAGGCTHAARHLAGLEIPRRLVRAERRDGVEQRHVDILAEPARIAFAQCRQDGDTGVEPGRQIDDGRTYLHRPAAGHTVRKPGHAHQPADALKDIVVARPFPQRPALAESGDRAIHQPWVERAQRCIIEPAPREVAELVVLDQHIGLLREPAHQRGACIVREIDRDGALVAIGAAEVGRIAGGLAVLVRQPRRAPRAGVVTGAGALDLDHISAEVGQRLRAGRAGEHARKVDHAQPGKSRAAGRGWSRWGHGVVGCVG